jgi:hypothetical protein
MPIPKTGETFDEALEGFRAAAEEILQAHFVRNDYTFAVPTIEIAKGGRKYAKLIRGEKDPETGEARPSRSVHSFVDKSTGEIFKAASFKAPAKHARGSIYRNHGRSMTNDAHIFYLR